MVAREDFPEDFVRGASTASCHWLAALAGAGQPAP